MRTSWGLREDNPNTRPWREVVAYSALAAMVGGTPLSGPVSVELGYVFPRPKSHYGTGRNRDTLKASAPHFHSVKPDLDKLCRAVFDSLSGICLRDDALIAFLMASKHYAQPGEPPGVHVTIRALV